MTSLKTLDNFWCLEQSLKIDLDVVFQKWVHEKAKIFFSNILEKKQ